MKIAFNCVGWAEDMRGVDRYYVELLNALLKIDGHNTYVIFTGTWQKYMDCFCNRPNALVVPIRWSSRRVLRNLWHGFIFPELVIKHDPDILHLPNTMPLIRKVCPTVCTIHDLLEYTYPQTFGSLQTRMRRFIVRGETNRADHIIVVSDLTANSLTEWLHIPQSRMTTIYSGVNNEIFYPSIKGYEQACEKFKIRKPYILFVSGIDRKKNALGLLQAYHQLRDPIKNGYQLVFAGKPDNAYEELQKSIRELGLQNHVIMLGQVENGLAVLYQGASLFVMPSFYEGFGLPVLEAMASGVPVIASKEVAIAQKLSTFCQLVDPYQIEEIVRAMTTILSSTAQRNKYIKAGLFGVQEYTWEKCAVNTLAIYDMLHRKKKS